MLQIHNSLTGRKEDVHAARARQGPHVRLRHHGVRLLPPRPRAHADRVRRGAALPARRRGYDVTFVRNITDIDDKIIQRAQRTASRCEALTERFIAAMDEDCAALGVLRRRPRAARHRVSSPQIIAMIAAADRQGLRLRRAQRRRVLRGREASPLRPALRQAARRPARRCARRGRRGQARSARFRAVEGGQARRARLGFAVGRGAARLAHRVLGDVGRRCWARTSTSTAAAWI